MTVTGGTFRTNPTAYVAEDYVAVGNADGTWTVKAKEAVRGATISGTTATGYVGEQVTVDANITYNTGLAVLLVGIEYDKDALKLVKAENGNALTKGEFTGLSDTFDSDVDEAKLLWYNAKVDDELVDDDGTGTLVKLTFELKKGGMHDVDFVVDGANDDALDINDANVPVTVEAAKITAKAFGDVDKSGEVDLNDVILLARHIDKRAGYVDESTATTDFTTEIADLNHDGKVNSKDLAILESKLHTPQSA